jgi:hypothetical protein
MDYDARIKLSNAFKLNGITTSYMMRAGITLE